MKTVTVEIPEGKRAEWVNGVLTLVNENPVNHKFNVDDEVIFKAANQICKVEKVIGYLSAPAYEVSGWDGILMETAFEPVPRDITERIKTFDDAKRWCNENGQKQIVDEYHQQPIKNMKREELAACRKVVNTKYGTEEEIIRVNVLMKDSVKGWVPAVVYEGIDRHTGARMTFCKAEKDFLNEFEL